MTVSGLAIRDVDLATDRSDIGDFDHDRPTLTLFWWRDLPLGLSMEKPEELPFGEASLAQKRTLYAAEQRIGRDPELGAPLRAMADAWLDCTPPLSKAAALGGFARFLNELTDQPLPAADDLTICVCTRDRPEALDRCLTGLSRQRSLAREIIVVDNSSSGSAAAVCARHGVVHVRESRPGLSRARNAGVARAATPLLAFTDDDVEPHPCWTGELVRAFDRHDVEAVTGLVLPARLDTEAQRMFQLDLGGFGSRFIPALFDPSFVQGSTRRGAQVWRIGAGANMAFRRSVFERVGLFDIRLGAGASGCSEDSELWYRMLATGGSCLYEPRAVVRHHHRSDWTGLERQIRAYMQGHVSALVAQRDLFGHSGHLRRIFLQLPRYFVRTALDGLLHGRPGRVRLLAQEVAGWAIGLQYFARPRWRRCRPRLPWPEVESR